MNLFIKLAKDSNKISLLLKDGETTVDSIDVEPGRVLDYVLIASVDKILKRNRIKPILLEKVGIIGQVDKNSSSHKIVMTFVNALKSKALSR